MVRKILKNLQGVIALIFILINVYMIILNWKIFRTPVELNLGFKTWETSLPFFLFFFSLLSILAIWLLSYIKDLRDENMIMKRDEEIRKLKSGETKKKIEDNNSEEDSNDDYV